MKLKHLSTCIGLVATSAIAFSAESARAASFDFTNNVALGGCGVLTDDLTTPLFQAFIDTNLEKSCTTAEGLTLTASDPGDGFLQGKMVGDTIGVGITVPGAGPVPAEVQNGELLTVDIPTESKIDFIDLGFLYRPGVFGDAVFEVAQIMTDTGLMGTLTVTGETSAVWSLGGVVSNLSPSKEVEGGQYRIDNPFGDIGGISSLKFTAPTAGKRPPTDSDYALVAIGTTPDIDQVPEPAALLGLTVVGGLMAASRRKKAS